MSRSGERLAAFYRDFDGAPIALESLETPQVVAVVRALCAVFDRLHRQGLCLVGTTPHAFLRDDSRKQVLLADAPFAQPIGAPFPRTNDDWIGSPYLAYAAPEVVVGQTLPLDPRCDLYSLGAILYQLVTTRPPFDSSDPAELIQCHLAKQPRPLLEVVPLLSPALARVLMRLLAKDPRERFESVSAFEQEFTRHVDSAVGKTARASPRIEQDGAGELGRFGTLIGHREPLRVLDEFVRRRGSTQVFALLEGEAGSGKSRLLSEIRRMGRGVMFCAGSFGRLGAGTPLGGWTGVLRELANSILVSDDHELELWRSRISAAVGDGAALLGALAPEWRAILRFESAAYDSSDASLNRLAIALQRLLQCCAESGRPVVLLLDDLHWADDSSLRILELLLTWPEPFELAAIGAARSCDEEGGEYAALRSLRTLLVAKSVTCQLVQMTPWSDAEIASFVSEAFDAELCAAPGLMELISTRTRGNPLFVRELLHSFVQQQVLVPTKPLTGWRWQTQVIGAVPLTSDIVALLAGRIRELPPEIEQAVRVAACVGPKFAVDDVCAAWGHDRQSTISCLVSAVAAGLVAPADQQLPHLEYEFVHDRVVDACKVASSAEERARWSLQLVRSRGGADPTALDDAELYKRARCIDAARSLIVDDEEQRLSIALNLEAGKRAKARGAYSQSFEYLHAALALASPERWRREPALMLELHEHAAGAALLTSNLQRMHALCDEILAHVRSPLQKIAAYDIRIRGLNTERKGSEAVAAALEILAELRVTFPRKPTLLHVTAGYLATKRRVFQGPIERLAAFPAMQEPHALAVARIIETVYAAAYLCAPQLFPLLIYKHVNASLDHGNEMYSAATYTGFALILAGLGDVERATAVAHVALRLLEQANARYLKARVFMGYYLFIYPWKNPVRTMLPFCEEGWRAGVEYGDFEYACYLMTVHSLNRLYAGTSLAELQPEFEAQRAKISSLAQERSILLEELLCQTVLDLSSEPRRLLAGPHYVELQGLARFQDPLDHNLIFHNHLAKLMMCVFLDRTEDARAAARLGREHLDSGAFANYLGIVFVFYESLALLRTGSGERISRNAALRVAVNQRKIAQAARRCPANFENKLHLVAAERCRVAGQLHAAAEHYERAIELSQLHGFPHETALAQERAADFYLARSLQRLARVYLREAYLGYRRWGAVGVTRRLEHAHPQQLALIEAGADAQLQSRNLDYRLLVKSSQAISGEILLPRLVEKLLKTMIEHAGAQRGLLLLERQGELSVEAEADIDHAEVELLKGESLEESDRLCHAIVHYSARLEKPVVLHDASRDEQFADDAYLKRRQARSVLCTPVLYQGKLLGLAYLENNRMSHVFTATRVELVGLLAAQAAISIANSRYHTLQLEAQQAKINPHFLFNALSSIADLALADGTKAEAAILKLAHLYRYILESSVQERVTLEQELAVVRNYLALEELRFGSKLRSSITCEGDPNRVKLPGLLIQPLAENCIRHGIAPKLDPGNVWIHAAVSETRCTIVIQDDGDGVRHGTAGTGFGLRSVQERLALMYGQHYAFAITQRGGYRVEIEVPVEPV
ncbi:MAG TPA: histidine kinase [Polyangiales bacterium]|nr:histidine kinase [Polyangiales bacterium]